MAERGLPHEHFRRGCVGDRILRAKEQRRSSDPDELTTSPSSGPRGLTRGTRKLRKLSARDLRVIGKPWSAAKTLLPLHGVKISPYPVGSLTRCRIPAYTHRKKRG